MLVSPEKKKHLKQLSELAAKVFGLQGKYWQEEAFMRNKYFGDATYDWNTSTIAIENNTIAAHYGVWNLQLRIGSVPVRVAGVGAVMTHGQMRGKGFISKCARSSISKMHENNYDLSLLFGISGLYHKYGYQRAWNETNHIVNTSSFPREKVKYKISARKSGDTDEMNNLHNRHNANLTGTARRPGFQYGVFLRNDKIKDYIWRDATGKLKGYVSLKSDAGKRELTCIDAAGDTETLLAVIGYQARKLNMATVNFPTQHEKSKLIKAIKRWDCKTEVTHQKSGGPMIKLINLPATLKKITPELQKRLKESESKIPADGLLIKNNSQKALLKMQKGKLVVTEKGTSKNMISGADEIAPLLFGSDDPQEIFEAAGTKVTSGAKKLASVLFPAQFPQLHTPDRF